MARHSRRNGEMGRNGVANDNSVDKTNKLIRVTNVVLRFF
jgi:hypothetical protein